MNELNSIKSFISDLITPIVKEAVAEALPQNIKKNEQNYIPVQRVTDDYGISQSKIYEMFKKGEIRKIKQGGLTFVSTAELESLMHTEKLCGKKPFKPQK